MERRINPIPNKNVLNVALLTALHSFRYKPQKLAVNMMVAMCKIQELAPFPSLLSPMP